MALTAGARLGSYEILTLLGSGGMGEVYRARDPKLGRDVAIKVLPASFAADPERLARFEREARLLASLNHPNIGAIYGVEESAGVTALVLELVEGETLDARLKASRSMERDGFSRAIGLPIGDALAIARQIADALDAAHERGIVHRDLKPANIVITPDGTVKVLDFGLAKATDANHVRRPFRGAGMDAGRGTGTAKAAPYDDAVPYEGHGDAAALTHSPTVLGPTVQGVLLGTAPYMSPEQARGKAVGKRTDIWAFGCVLYEMLTGRRAFAGETTTDTLAAILEHQPDWSALPAGTPATIRRLLARCLEKDPKRRLRDIGDARLDIDDAVAAPTPVAATAASGRAHRRAGVGWIALLLTVASLSAGWGIGRRRAPPAAATDAALAAVTLTPLTTDPGYEGEPTFAPDGETIAYVSDRAGNFDIFLKQASGGRDINLTNDPSDDIQPAFSPDGKQIAFVSSRSGTSAILPYGTDNPLMGGDIWVMPALGGSARRIAEKGNFPSWSPDGSQIFFISGPWFGKKLYKVSASGGKPEEIPVQIAPAPNLLMYSTCSPDGRWIAFEATGANIYAVPSGGGEPRRIAHGHRPLWSADGRAVMYSSQEPGKNYSLWRVPFSTVEGTVAGASQPLTISHGRHVPGSASRDGRRIAFTAQEHSFNLEIMPFDAEAGRELGKPEALTFGIQSIFFWSFSPDGRSLVFESHRGASSNIWRLDLGSVQVALTSDASFEDTSPRWSPDGSRILFSRRSSKNLQADAGLWIMTADGASPRVLVESASGGVGGKWLPDGRSVVYFRGGQLHRLALETNQSRPLTNEPRVMPITTITSDGKWVVYQSTASGNVDLRIVSTDGGPSRVVVATPGEDYHPLLSPSGRWLYFQPDHKNLFRVPGPVQDWRQAPPEKVTHFPESGLSLEDTQASPDGRRLAFSRGRITGDVWILDLGK